MLNLWYGDGYEGEYIKRPKNDFEYLYEDSWFESEFSKRVIDVCSGGLKTVLPNIFENHAGIYLSHKVLSQGAKTLLLLRYMDYPCSYTFCGENCNPFIGDILEEKDDVTLIVVHFYIPDDKICSKYGVKLLNTDEVFYSETDLVRCLIDNMLF